MGYVYIGELPSSSLKVAQLIRLTSASVAPMPWLIVLVRFSRCEVLAPLNPSGAARKPSGAPRKPSGAPPNRQGKWENLRRTSENLRPIAAKSAGYSSLPRVPRVFCGGSGLTFIGGIDAVRSFSSSSTIHNAALTVPKSRARGLLAY